MKNKQTPQTPIINSDRKITRCYDVIDIPDGYKVFSMEPFSGCVCNNEAQRVSIPGEPKMCKVELTNGRTFFAPYDLPCLWGVDADEQNYELRTIAPKDAVDRKIVVPVVKDLIGSICKGVGMIREIEITPNRSCPFHHQLLGFQFGWLLGALCGNGWWDKKDLDFSSGDQWLSNRAIYLADLKGECAKRVNSILQDMFCQEQSIQYHSKRQKKSDHQSRYGDSTKHTWKFKWLEEITDFLSLHLGGERDQSTSGAGNKHLPLFFLHAPEEFRIGLLCGLVDTDGSCTVSHSKEKAQLICNYTSISLRLIQEIELLCRSLGVEATISKSKETSSGNILWVITMSSVDCKAKNLFSRLASKHKREAFLNTEVSSKNTSEKFVRVFLPKVILSKLRKGFTAGKIKSTDRHLDTPEIQHKKHLENLSVQILKAKKTGIASRSAIMKAIEENQKAVSKNPFFTPNLMDDFEFVEWKSHFFDNEAISWAGVKSIELIDDDNAPGFIGFHVPEYGNYMNCQGVLIGGTFKNVA